MKASVPELKMTCQISAASHLSLQVGPRNLFEEEENCYLCSFIPLRVLQCKVVRDKGNAQALVGRRCSPAVAVVIRRV